MEPDTPFMAFWNALNIQLHEAHRLPEIRYGAALGIWEDAMSAARMASMEPVGDRIMDSSLATYKAFD